MLSTIPGVQRVWGTRWSGHQLQCPSCSWSRAVPQRATAAPQAASTASVKDSACHHDVLLIDGSNLRPFARSQAGTLYAVLAGLSITACFTAHLRFLKAATQASQASKERHLECCVSYLGLAHPSQQPLQNCCHTATHASPLIFSC
jgi:hypothetical protein